MMAVNPNVAAAIAEQPGFRAGREAERTDFIKMIRDRAVSVGQLCKRGRLTEAEAFGLKRWLTALADDAEQGLHESD